MSAPENPPAFPNTGNSTWDLAPAPGMTLRDWFAGQALRALRAQTMPSLTPEQAAKAAFAFADAMLAERKSREAAMLSERDG